MIRLADFLDQLSARGAFLSESELDVIVSNLTLNDAKEVLTLCSELGWNALAYDTEGSEWSSDELSAEFAPFRIPIRKPQPAANTLQLLTNTGLSHWLEIGSNWTRWRVARLSASFRTRGRIFEPWGNNETFEPTPPTKSPRSLVREYTAQRLVPADIRPWLLPEDNAALFEDQTFRIWANASIHAISRTLADEIDSEDHTFKFKGPPRLSLTPPNDEVDLVEALGKEGFNNLQRAANWVFENEREAEMRHILLATELARSGAGHEDAISCIKREILAALEGAKIAYQMSMSEVGQDTLKLLAELRKSITEETSKLTETTRQLVAAVASALAVGIGLIAVRLSTNAHPYLIMAVMVVAAVYVLMVILSGFQFACLQRRLRRDWQPRLYRFLPESDYKRMVSTPTGQAERAFGWAAAIGGAAIVLLTVIVIYTANLPKISINASLENMQTLQKSTETKSTPPGPDPAQATSGQATKNDPVKAPDPILRDPREAQRVK